MIASVTSPPPSRSRPALFLFRGIGFVKAGVRSDLGGNALWYTALQGAERVAAVIQTVLLSRLLGMHDYGVFGMVFATLGLVTSIAGLQAGLTATVFISRYLASDKAKVAGVIAMVDRFGIVAGVVLTVALLPFYQPIARGLLHQAGYDSVVIVAILFVAATIVSGIQDGIAQGFEAFRYIARLKLMLAVVGLALVIPAAKYYSLAGVFVVLLGLLVVKFLFMAVKVQELKQAACIPRKGSPVSFMQIMVDFALPSMSVSFVFGWAMWSGLYLSSRGAAGFAAVAVINVGLQWRGPAQLFTASLSNVAVPYFSRHLGTNDHARAGQLRRRLLWSNSLLALLATAPVAVAAPLIMPIYGSGFVGGAWPFALIVISVVPYALANVYMQELVGGARMWRQLWIQLPFCVLLVGGFFLWVPRFGALGYGGTLLIANSLFLLIVIALDRRSEWRQSPAEI
ncbi:MAG: oligosaccharide flippase family protein [Sphingomicrobium sp.]